MANHSELDSLVNRMILEGKAMEAFETYYAEDVVMQENTDAPRVGKEVNRQYEIAFFSNIETFFGGEVSASAFADDVGFSEWVWDFQMKGQPRFKMHQAAVRRWKDGKVVAERFYHS